MPNTRSVNTEFQVLWAPEQQKKLHTKVLITINGVSSQKIIEYQGSKVKHRDQET